MIQKAAWLQDSGEHSKVVGDCANMGKMVGTYVAFKAATINREMTLNYIGEYILGLPKSY